MSELTRSLYSRRYRRARRGQTLIVALAVLFILLFVGGLFIARIARNLVTAGRSRDTQDAQALALAGLDYCNDRINNSPEGADWRPTPSAPINNQDPDYYWLERGFYRLALKGGRALVRVSYDPNATNPTGQALRLEAIGRTGEMPVPAGSDPTVFVPNFISPRLRRELIAYKQIGLTDFLFYMTGKDRPAAGNFLGTPAIGHNVATVLGNPMLGFPQYKNGLDANSQNVLFGAPIYCTGDLTLGGDTYIYESPRGESPFEQQEKVLVDGNITLAPSRTVADYNTVNDAQFPAYFGLWPGGNQQIDQSPNANNAIQPSNVQQFNSFGGLLRDNSTSNDVNGNQRGVPRLEPPLIDTTANGTGTLRYRMLTRDSGFWYNINGTELNSGQFGYGRGIYVDNRGDLQRETTNPSITGGYSLRSDWLNPGVSPFWGGPFYDPPGLQIQLLGNMIRLTRDPKYDNNRFYNSDLTTNPQNGGTTIDIPLSDFDRRSVTLPGGAQLAIFPHDGDEPVTPFTANGPSNSNNPFGDKQSYGVNVVLFAEGNVRVRGVYGAITNTTQTIEQNTAQGPQRKLGRVHLTIVSGGTAYIDGNLVRGDGYTTDGKNVTYERASTCAILAKDYVCVNTTQFMQPQNQATTWSPQGGVDFSAFNTEIGQTQGQTYDAAFSWGVDPTLYLTNGNQSPTFLLVRHGSLGDSGTTALINLLFNPALAANPAAALYQFANAGFTTNFVPGDPFAYEVSDLTNAGQNKLLPYDSIAFPIGAGAGQNFAAINTPGYDNIVRFQVDQTAQGLATIPVGATDDYLLGGAAVVPQDIRIEAALYAQEKSFFIIPGYSFNPDPADDRYSYEVHKVRTSYTQADTEDAPNDPNAVNDPQRKARDIFPFYGEPIDARITIYGSIAQNYTASMGDQKAWMERWGYIPQYYGSACPVPYGNYTQPVQIPDDHLFARDPVGSGLTPGEDTTLDYRTPLESQNQQAGLSPNAADIPITNGLRYEYNPTFAMPYENPADFTLNGDNVANAQTRKHRALRSIATNITVGGQNGATYKVVQVLPPIPRLPVCPNYIYAGESDRLIGSAPIDTDNLTDLGG